MPYRAQDTTNTPKEKRHRMTLYQGNSERKESCLKDQNIRRSLIDSISTHLHDFSGANDQRKRRTLDKNLQGQVIQLQIEEKPTI